MRWGLSGVLFGAALAISVPAHACGISTPCGSGYGLGSLDRQNSRDLDWEGYQEAQHEIRAQAREDRRDARRSDRALGYCPHALGEPCY